MGFRIREIEVESKFSDELTLEAIGRAVPMEEIVAVIRDEGVQEARQRRLNMVTVLLLVIAMNIHTRLSIGHVMREIAQGVRFFWSDPSYRLPKDSTTAYRSHPRVVKRKMSKFHLMRPEHYHWPQPTRSLRQALVLI